MKLFKYTDKIVLLCLFVFVNSTFAAKKEETQQLQNTNAELISKLTADNKELWNIVQKYSAEIKVMQQQQVEQIQMQIEEQKHKPEAVNMVDEENENVGIYNFEQNKQDIDESIATIKGTKTELTRLNKEIQKAEKEKSALEQKYNNDIAALNVQKNEAIQELQNDFETQLHNAEKSKEAILQSFKEFSDNTQKTIEKLDDERELFAHAYTEHKKQLDNILKEAQQSKDKKIRKFIEQFSSLKYEIKQLNNI